METFESVIEAAIANLHPRARYARDVIRGRQRWSGADLRGLAKTRFGPAYAAQRDNALRALERAGGAVISIAPHGLLITAVPVGEGRYTDARGRVFNAVSGYKLFRPVQKEG